LMLLVSSIPAAFGVIFVVVSLVLAAFGALTGMRLYRMPYRAFTISPLEAHVLLV